MTRQTIYHPMYGYVSTGNGLSDVFNFITKSFKSLPPPLLTARKKAATSIATQGITATGDRIGSALANRISPKDKYPITPGKPTTLVDSKKLLQDLKLATSKAGDINSVE